MAFLWLYILVILAALIWVGVDKHATGAFEFFSRNNHATARSMGMYVEFVRYSLGRLAILTVLVTLSVFVAILVFANNPLDWGQATRGIVLGAMLAGSLALFALPYLAARLRFMHLLFSKTAQLTELVAVAQSESEAQHRFDVAEYETGSEWTAWHPKDFKHNSLWSGMVPVIYLKQGIASSLVIPIDFGQFLAWKFPAEVQPGEYLPFCGPGDAKFQMKTIHKILGRQGWSVVRAEMELDW